jgi:hypothetical protein
VVFGIGGSMKERPILFNGAMVRAILDGSKTQTRRLANTGHYAIDEEYHGIEVAMRERAAMIKNCPLGQVGDQLWVRETWRGIVQINGPHEQYQTGVARYVPDQEKCIRVEYLASHSKDSATLQAFKNGGNANYLRSERDALQAQVNFFNEEKIKAGINWHKETNSWNPIIKPGQVKVGDKLKFKIGDKEYRETAKQILNQGTDKEEVIYNIQKNFYFITSMIISGFSNHKFVEVLEQK